MWLPKGWTKKQRITGKDITKDEYFFDGNIEEVIEKLEKYRDEAKEEGYHTVEISASYNGGHEIIYNFLFIRDETEEERKQRVRETKERRKQFKEREKARENLEDNPKYKEFKKLKEEFGKIGIY
jgi:hypothetical protein